MTILQKLVLSFIVSIALAIGAVTFIVAVQVGKESLTRYEISSQGELTRVNDFIRSFLEEAQSNAQYVAKLPQTLSAIEHLPNYVEKTGGDILIPRQKMTPQLGDVFDAYELMRTTHPSYGAVLAGGADGGFIQAPELALPGGYDPRTRGWYKDAAAMGVIISKAYALPNGTPVSTVAAKVETNGKTVGVVGIDISLASLTQVTSSIRLGKSGYVILVEDTGVILSDAVHKEYAFKNAKDIKIPAFAQVMSTQKGTFQSELDGKKVLISVVPGYAGWKLASVIDEDEVYAESHALLRNLALMGLGIATLLLLPAWLMARSIVRPIDKLVVASRAVAAGDFDSLPGGKGFTGELKALHRSLEIMVTSIRELLQTSRSKTLEAEQQTVMAREALELAEKARTESIQARQEGAVQTATRLEGIVSEVTAAARELSQQINEAQKQATRQSCRTEQVSVAMSQMNDSVLDVADSADLAAKEADKTREQAANGGQVVRDVIERMNVISESARLMSENVRKLGVQVQDIDRIMTMISDVADQTNLLALNAAIEAARAGESGRGFAVVADEVRKLAEKTRGATGEVASAVNAIQSSVHDSADKMEQAYGAVTECAGKVVEAGEMLGGIITMAEESASQIQTIACTSQKQSASSITITDTTREVNNLSGALSKTMEQSASSVDSLTHQVDELQDIIRQLKHE